MIKIKRKWIIIGVVVLTIVGYFVVNGFLMGMLFAKTIETYFQFHPLFYLKADVSLGLILFSIVFSFFVGCVSGYFPARAAAKMKPVDALRYE